MNNPASQTCAHKDCECAVNAASVAQGGKRYCTQECADGKGCAHLNCGCGSELETETEENDAFAEMLDPPVAFL
jgi:hypothetical protein